LSNQIPKQITFIYMDDWQALYIDGKLVYENHNISAKELLDYIPIEFQTVDLYDEEEYEKLEGVMRSTAP